METLLEVDFALFQLFHYYSRSPRYLKEAKGNQPVAEERGPRPSSLKDIKIFPLAFPVVHAKYTTNLVISRRSCAATAKKFARKNKTEQSKTNKHKTDHLFC